MTTTTSRTRWAATSAAPAGRSTSRGRPSTPSRLSRANRYRFCLIDVNLPRVDGIELARLLHRRQEGATIVLMSGDPDAAWRATDLKDFVFAVVHKPLPLHVLNRYLSMLGRRRAAT